MALETKYLQEIRDNSKQLTYVINPQEPTKEISNLQGIVSLL